MFNTIGLLSVLFITLFGGAFILASSDQETENRKYLSFFYFDSAILFLGHFVTFFEFWKVFRYFDFLFIFSLIAFYPFYFLYLNKAFQLNMTFFKWKSHLIPSIVLGVLMLAATLVASPEHYNEYMNHSLFGTPIFHWQSKFLLIVYVASRAFHVLQILYYNFRSIQIMLRAKKMIENSYSHINLMSLNNFNYVNSIFLILMGIPGIYVTIMGRLRIQENGFELGILSLIFMSLYLLLGITVLRQKPFERLTIDYEKPTEEEEVPSEYSEATCLEQIQRIFDEQKPWLNPSLNIWEVASLLGTNRTYISKCINDTLDCNFNVFVNNYRVAEAKKKLKNKNYNTSSLTELALLCGFGSLSSFNRIFKEMTGKTPATYRNENG